MREAIRQPTFGGAMGVLDFSKSFKLPFFMPPRPPLAPRIPPGRAGPSHLGALVHVPSGHFEPICCNVGPCRSTLWPIRGSALLGPLSLYPLADSGRFVAISALVPLPSGRFDKFSRLGALGPLPSSRFDKCPRLRIQPFVSAPPPCPCRSTLWPIRTNLPMPLASGRGDVQSEQPVPFNRAFRLQPHGGGDPSLSLLHWSIPR